MRRMHSLQHVPFEDMANIEVWAADKGHDVSKTLLFNGEQLPAIDDFDWLVVMGGPMGIYDEDEYPWLAEEKKLIEKAVVNKKTVLGVCLGAQLIADVLGANVFKNRYKEIGWFPVSLTSEAGDSAQFRNMPEKFIAFHWHGDTFDIPSECIRIAESEGCPNQAFEYDGRVVGLQFHLESSLESIGKLIQNGRDEIIEAKYIQTADEMLSSQGNINKIGRIMNVLLDNM